MTVHHQSNPADNHLSSNSQSDAPTSQARSAICEPTLTPKSINRLLLFFILGLLFAFAARLVISAVVPGYHNDIEYFRTWSLRMVGRGVWGFFTANYFCDYPPGYLLLLWPVGLLLLIRGNFEPWFVRMVKKSIPMLCDLADSILLFCYAIRSLSLRTAIMVSLVFAFNPSVIINSAAWGQTDSVLALLIGCTAIAAMSINWRMPIPFYIVSILVKPQALISSPIACV